MDRSSNADIAAFSLDAGDYLGRLKSANFNWELTLAECAGIKNRYSPQVETKRVLAFSAEMNRKSTDAGVCETNKTVSTISMGATDVLGSWESGEISFANSNTRSDAGGATLGTVQLHRPTTFSGSLNLHVDKESATLLSSFVDAGFSPSLTFTFTDGAGTFTVATTIKGAGKSWPEAGLMMQTVTFEGGTISGGGGGLFATGCTGTGAVAFIANDGGDHVSGTMVILSGRFAFSNNNRTTQSFTFHVNSVTDENA